MTGSREPRSGRSDSANTRAGRPLRGILSQRYHDKLLHLPQRRYDSELTGTIISRLNRSITSITDLFKTFSGSFFPLLLTISAVLVIGRGKREIKLSGGQKQRISVARALLKDAPIPVFDEATSALGTKAERALRAGLDELLEGRTTPIIEHRLSTISPVDRIATLHEGHIDEIGSPAELAASRHLHRAAGSRIRLARPAGQNCCAVTSPTDPILLF